MVQFIKIHKKTSRHSGDPPPRPYTYYAATLWKKPEQTYEQSLRFRPDERTDKSEFVGPNSASSGEDQQKYEKYDWKYVIPEIPENVLLEIRWFCDAILGHLLRVGCCWTILTRLRPESAPSSWWSRVRESGRQLSLHWSGIKSQIWEFYSEKNPPFFEGQKITFLW